MREFHTLKIAAGVDFHFDQAIATSCPTILSFFVEETYVFQWAATKLFVQNRHPGVYYPKKLNKPLHLFMNFYLLSLGSRS